MTDVAMIENTIPESVRFAEAGNFSYRVDTDDDSFAFSLLACNFTGFFGHPFLPRERVPNEVYLSIQNQRSGMSGRRTGEERTS